MATPRLVDIRRSIERRLRVTIVVGLDRVLTIGRLGVTAIRSMLRGISLRRSSITSLIVLARRRNGSRRRLRRSWRSARSPMLLGRRIDWLMGARVGGSWLSARAVHRLWVLTAVRIGGRRPRSCCLMVGATIRPASTSSAVATTCGRRSIRMSIWS